MNLCNERTPRVPSRINLRYPLKDFRNEERILKKAREDILSHL